MRIRSAVLGRAWRRSAVPAVLAAALLLSSCGSSDSSSSSSEPSSSAPSSSASSTESPSTGSSSGAADLLPEEFRNKGAVTIATAVGNPPYASIEEGSDDPVGFDMDLVTALTEHLGIEPKIEVVQFPTIIPGLSAGRFDLAISSLTITPERTETLDLLAYMRIGTGLLVQAGNPNGISSITDLCGLKVGVSKGSSNQIPLNDAQSECADKPINIVETEGNDFVALQSARVDAMALDAAGSFAAAKANPEAFEAVGGEVYAAGIAGIAFDKSNGELAAAYQAALEELIADGTYDELLAKWGLEELGYTDTAINPQG